METVTMGNKGQPTAVTVERGSAEKAVPVVPSDTIDLADGASKGLYLGTSGNVTVIMASGGPAVTYNALSAGLIHPISVRRVLATGTTATLMLAVY